MHNGEGLGESEAYRQALELADLWIVRYYNAQAYLDGGFAAEASGEAEPLAKGSVVASDAFFPFADGLLTAAAAGATAVIQPGGSIRDDEVIAAANEQDLAMVTTGIRHFRH